ncbi:procathepsin L-like [Protopterus annectens]|uniref:procathepsin L-like n=1 Tax=Protopterus annectens TaxID=7888 RepID=UPI001CFC1C39|nr:procathepsin L-like [Protopterus annectens]
MASQYLILFFFILETLSASFSFRRNPALDESWKGWKLFHGRLYQENEEIYRRMVWEKNYQIIELHNQEHAEGKHTYRLRMNHFGDLTNAEFNKLMNRFRPLESKLLDDSIHVFKASPSFKSPEEVDWRPKGYVTPVKFQGHCGSCWSFSATGALEGQLFKKTGRLVSLSEQNLIDCSRQLGNNGCSGGYIVRGFQYVKANGGIDTESYYPYAERDDLPCKYNDQYKAANCTTVSMVDRGSEKALEQAVATVGPVSVAVDAKLSSFQFYHSGIYSDIFCSGLVNHAVLAVGYGTLNNTDGTKTNYWIIKNSWGEHWGENGYIRLVKDKDSHCGVANQASFPSM